MRTSALLFIVLGGCAGTGGSIRREFLDEVARSSQTSSVRFGSSEIRLGQPASDLPVGCSKRFRKAVECARGGGPHHMLRLDKDETVSSISLYSETGPVDFVCSLFRLLNADVGSRMAAQPFREEGECTCGSRTGCSGEPGATRVWKFGASELLLIASPNLERMTAPDGTRLLELELVLAVASEE